MWGLAIAAFGLGAAPFVAKAAQAPSVQEVREAATETWDCKWTAVTGIDRITGVDRKSITVEGSSVVQISRASVYWEMRDLTVSGWVLFPYMLVENDERALVGVHTTANEDLGSEAVPPVGANVILIDKATGHFRLGSVMEGDDYGLLEGRCERKSPRPFK